MIGKPKGRTSIEKKFPEILTYIQEFIDINCDSSANVRRRNDLSYVGGFTSKQLKDYVEVRFLQENGKVFQMSESTLQRLFIPPNKHANAASYYKSLFNIKVMGGKNLSLQYKYYKNLQIR